MYVTFESTENSRDLVALVRKFFTKLSIMIVTWTRIELVIRKQMPKIA
jgi:hypothetical protein